MLMLVMIFTGTISASLSTSSPAVVRAQDTETTTVQTAEENYEANVQAVSEKDGANAQAKSGEEEDKPQASSEEEDSDIQPAAGASAQSAAQSAAGASAQSAVQSAAGAAAQPAAQPAAGAAAQPAAQPAAGAAAEAGEEAAGNTVVRRNQQNRNGEVSTDLKDYLTSVTIRKFTNGTWSDVSGEELTFTHGESIQAELLWELSGDVHKAHKEFTYTLPAAFQVDDDVTGFVYRGDTTEDVGTFTIKDGIVTVVYNDNYNSENDTTNNKMTITATASLDNEKGEDKIQFDEEDNQVIIKIESDGDFEIKKTAQKVYPNNQLSDKTKVEYTVEIDSKYGTAGNRISVKDTLAKVGNNLITKMAYDASSFKLVDHAGNPVSFVNAEGTEISSAEAVTINGTTVVINYLPALGKGEKYILSYSVNVEENGKDNTAALVMANINYSDYIDNKVEATAGDKTHEDTTRTRFPAKIRKNNATYDSATNLMRWSVGVNGDGLSLKGYTFRDTSTQELNKTSDGKYDIVVTTVTADGTTVQVPYDDLVITTEVVDGKHSFFFELPIDGVSYSIAYNTKVNPGEVGSKNNAVIITPDEKEDWSAIGIGYPTNFTKSSTDVGTPDENGIVPINWTMTLDTVNPVELTGDFYRFDDYIKTAYKVGNSSTKYEDLHYGYAADLDAQLRKNLKFTISRTDSNGNTVLYDDVTMENNRGYDIRILYYAEGWKGIATSTVGSELQTDRSTKVEFVVMQIRKGTSEGTSYLQKAEITEYTTFFDTKNYNIGETWRVENQVAGYNRSATSTADYKAQQSSVTKLVGVPTEETAGKAPTSWRSSNATINYEYTQTTLAKGTQLEQEASRVFYRILITPEGDEDIEITDRLPNGMTTLAKKTFEIQQGTSVVGREISLPAYDDGSGDFRVGPFDGNSVEMASSRGWGEERGNGNITITFNEDNSFTLRIKNRNQTDANGNKILRADEKTGQIGFQYSCIIEDWEAVREFIEDDVNKEHAEFTNSVTVNGGDPANVTADVVRTRDALTKSGEQVKNSNGLTARASYEIRINETGRDMLADSNVLTFTDTVRSSDLKFNLDRDSITLYRMNPDGSRGDKENINNIQIGEAEVVKGELTQKITMNIADETPYILVYEYSISEVTNGSTQGLLSNTAEIVGVVSVNRDVEMKSISATASSDHGSLTLHKVDQDNNLKYLPNVEFEIQEYKNGSFVTVQDSRFTIKENEDGTRGVGKVFDYNIDTLWKNLSVNTIYRIVEVNNPNKAYRAQTQEEATYFFIKENIGAGSNIQFETDEAARARVLGSTEILDDVKVSDIVLHALQPNRSTTIYITNELLKIELPETGESGVASLYQMSIMLLLLFAVVFAYKKIR